MTETIHEISLVLGQLSAKLDNMVEDNRNAAKSRKETHESLEQVRLHIASLEKRVESLENRIKAVEGPLSKWEQWQQRGVGAVMIIGVVAVLVGGSIATLWQKIISLITRY